MQRNEGETFEQYRVRRTEANKAVKALKRGVVFWDSTYQGTYTNPEKRALKAARKAKKAQRKQAN